MSLTLNIRSVTGFSAQVVVARQAMVADIKEQLRELHGFPPFEQILMTKKVVLEDQLPLRDAGIDDGVTLFLLLRNSGSKDPFSVGAIFSAVD